METTGGKPSEFQRNKRMSSSNKMTFFFQNTIHSDNYICLLSLSMPVMSLVVEVVRDSVDRSTYWNTTPSVPDLFLCCQIPHYIHVHSLNFPSSFL